MDIGKFLKKVGTAVLKNVPMGGLVYDIADAALSTAVPDDVTGDQLATILQTLPPDQYSKVMSKQLDAKLATYTAWTDLRKEMDSESPQSNARSVISIIFSVGIMILVILFTLMMGDNYLKTGQLPGIELIGAVMLVPGIAILSTFGVRSDTIVSNIIGAYVKRIK